MDLLEKAEASRKLEASAPTPKKDKKKSAWNAPEKKKQDKPIIVEKVKSNPISITTEEESENFAMVLKGAPIQDMQILPTKDEVDYRVDLIEHIKNSVVSKEDYGMMHNQTFLRASGFDKFVHYFKINISYPKRDVHEDKEGWHCDVICRVEAPWGQAIESYGGASMNTMTIRKTRHNMIALAETRAKTRAVRTLMGFSRPSYEEMMGSEEKSEWLT